MVATHLIKKHKRSSLESVFGLSSLGYYVNMRVQHGGLCGRGHAPYVDIKSSRPLFLENYYDQSWGFYNFFFWKQYTHREIPTRLGFVAVASDFYHVGFCLKPQLFRLESVAEPQLGNICTG